MYSDGRGRRRRWQRGIGDAAQRHLTSDNQSTVDDVTSDALMPANRANDLPEHKMWADVLERTVADLKGTRIRPKNRHDAKAFFSDPSEELGSFRWICHILHIDPDGFLRKLHNA